MGSSPDISVSVTESVSIDKVTETDMQSSQTSLLETTPSTMTGENKENEEKDEREPLGGRVIPEGELTFDEDGLPVLTDQELETASKVLQVFYRFPETAVGARFVKYSKEYNLRQNVRINAMRWLKPGNVPSVKTILKTKQTNELEVLHSSGIRLGRNRKKRLLPNQLGQVYIGANEDDEPALLLPPSDNNQLVDASQSTTGETVPIDTASGYNVPVAEATKNFVPFKRKDISDTFRVHPSVDAVPLSSAEKTFNNDMSDEHIIPNVEKISKTTKSSVEVELIEDEAIASESESDAKRVKTGENSVKSIKPSEVLRARHATNYTAENPQPAGETLQPDAEILSPTNVQLLQMESVSGTFSVSKDTRIDPQSASDYLKVDARTGLQSVAETADIAQRYARSFTGSNVPINVNGTTKVAGSPSSNTTEAAFVEEVDENEDVDNTPKSNDFNDGMSRDNKIIKKGKQEQQQWSSKENLYGGSVKVVDENAVKDEKVEESLSAKAQMPEIEVPEGRPRALKNAIPCYVCKRHFKVLHHFYDRLCPTCAEFNYKKRFQTADMVIRRRDPNTRELVVTPRVCLVTGARVKIGYEIAIKLLRAGAFVIATSRFAHDTALRFYKEDDFHEWKDRLHIYALDFRVISAVEMFANYILRMYPRLDMVMNNAAQTIRRPPQFYRHLLQQERIPLEALPECVQPLVQDFLAPEFRKAAVKTSVQLLETFGFSKNAAAITHLANPKLAEDAKTMDDSTTGTDAEKTSTEKTSTEKTDNANSLQVYGDDANTMSTRLVTMLSHPSAIAINPAELTQLALVSGDEDKEEDAEIFPVGLLDKDDQQIDLRDRQTWVLQADEVSTVELAEVQLVNSMAPFILNTKLKPLLKRSGDPTWVINVTSMEGKFRGFKDTTHPHTNMAKAALNMFTHTSSKDFAHDRIFMNAVDTGWVTEELPHAIAVHKANIGFAPPLDENDGASRCLDPVFTSLLTGVYEFGKFFKDYGEGHW